MTTYFKKNKKKAIYAIIGLCIEVMVLAIFAFEKGEILGTILAS